MNTYHPQIKKELGFPAVCWEKKKKKQQKKNLSQMPKMHQGGPAPKNALNKDLNYKKMSSAAA